MELQVHGPLADEALDALVLVLDEIRFGRARSRPELVARTGLTRAIVAQRVGELLDRGLVTEGEVGPSTGGRPPRQLTFRADAGHVLVADLGATSIDVAVTSLDGRILGHHDEPAQIEAGPDRCLDRVDALFGSLLATAEAIPGPLWGIGI
ncbi:MAG: sugar kinase, partial [Candidatus Limnocylindrales bacterium]